jgi:hypothetical protein
MRAAHQYLFQRDIENKAAKAKAQAVAVPGEKGGNLLKDYVAANGEETAEGHLEWYFDEPVTIGDETYKGLRNQRKPGEPLLDEERAEELLTKLGLRDEVIKEVTVEVADWQQLYVLNQEGKLTDEQLDSLFDEPEPSYSLVVIK